MNTVQEDSVKKAHNVKIIVLGDCGVGKTSLINQYVHRNFKKQTSKEVLCKEVVVDGKDLNLQIHDTGGRECKGGQGFEASFYNEAKACMLVYDVNDHDSIKMLKYWHSEFSTKVNLNPLSSESFPFVVIGNKDDRDNSKKVDTMAATEWCQDKKIMHYLTSAKDNKNVVEAFEFLAGLVVKHNPKPTFEPPTGAGQLIGQFPTNQSSVATPKTSSSNLVESKTPYTTSDPPITMPSIPIPPTITNSSRTNSNSNEGKVPYDRKPSYKAKDEEEEPKKGNLAFTRKPTYGKTPSFSSKPPKANTEKDPCCTIS